jgi:hypothetical protein
VGSVVDVVVESALGNGSNAKHDASAVVASRSRTRVQSLAASACAWPGSALAEGKPFCADSNVSLWELVFEDGIVEAIFTTVFPMRIVVFLTAALCSKAV